MGLNLCVKSIEQRLTASDDKLTSARCAARYICTSFCLFVCFCVWRSSPQWARASSFKRFLDHTQRRTTVSRTRLGHLHILLLTKYIQPSLVSACQDSLVAIATRYGLYGTGIKSRQRRDFPCRPDGPQGPPNLLGQWVLGLSRGWSGQSVVLTSQLLLLLGFNWVGIVPPPPVCACIGMSTGDLYLYSYVPTFCRAMLWDRMVRSSLPRTDSFLHLISSEVPKVWHETNLIQGTCVMNGHVACLPVLGLSVSTYVQTLILRASLCGDFMTNYANSLRTKGCLYHRTVVSTLNDGL